jgi:hypothetical protein
MTLTERSVGMMGLSFSIEHPQPLCTLRRIEEIARQNGQITAFSGKPSVILPKAYCKTKEIHVYDGRRPPSDSKGDVGCQFR